MQKRTSIHHCQARACKTLFTLSRPLAGSWMLLALPVQGYTPTPNQGSIAAAVKFSPAPATGGLAVERESDIIALITDSFAIIFNAREGTNDDHLFTPHAASVPPQGLPPTLSISLTH